MGYTYVERPHGAERGARAGATKLLGLFRTSHMNVAYDKLGLVRPADEVTPPTNGPVNFGGFTNQPFLDEMTEKAHRGALARRPSVHPDGRGRVDRQAVAPEPRGRTDLGHDRVRQGDRRGPRLRRARTRRTLVCVSADHDQSMSIIGVVDTNIVSPIPPPWTNLNVRSTHPYPFTKTVGAAVGGSNVGEVDGFPDYADANGDGYPENTNRFKLAVGYRTGNHTGSSVPITAEGPGALLFTGYFDQTDIFFKAAKVLSIDTDDLDHCLKEVMKSQPSCEKPRHKARKWKWNWPRKHLGDCDCD